MFLFFFFENLVCISVDTRGDELHYVFFLLLFFFFFFLGGGASGNANTPKTTHSYIFAEIKERDFPPNITQDSLRNTFICIRADPLRVYHYTFILHFLHFFFSFFAFYKLTIT